MSRASAARRRALRAYLIDLRDRMRLQAWDLAISEHSPESDSILEILPQSTRHNGAVRIGTFFSESRAEQRQTAVHELVHLIQAPLWEFFSEPAAWKEVTSADLAGHLTHRVHDELEVQADAIARLLSPRMPLPPAWPK